MTTSESTTAAAGIHPTGPQPPKTPWSVILTRLACALLLLGALGWGYHGSEVDFAKLLRNRDNIAVFASEFIHPDFSDWRLYIEEIGVTLAIGLWGTFLAVLLAVPGGLLCASNVTPWWINQPVRRLMDAFRAINEMIFALLFIAAVGLGPFAGMLALFVHTLGTLSKLFSEAVETIDPRPVQGIRATGASKLDEIVYGVIPQVMSLWISYTLYRFESNVRSASVIGMVGGGGIGFLLFEAMNGYEFDRASAILILIIITVVIIDLVSSQIRKRFI